MSSDLRVALRIQATAGNSRREIEQVNRDLHKAGKEGARTLADESWNATTAITRIGKTGALSYKNLRGAIRESTKASAKTRIELSKTEAEFKAMAQAARKAARDAKAELTNTDREGIQPLRQGVDKTEASFRRLSQNGGRHLRTLKTIAAGVRNEFNHLKGLGSSAQGQLAGLGLGVGVVEGLKNSARLDRQLIRTQQTASMTVGQREEWRTEQWGLAKTYGVDREQVQSGFDTLIASGLSYEASRESANAIAQATAVTGADPSVLAKALVTGASAYDIDLAQPDAALDLLQKMIVAGRLGNAELENLASIFPKMGQDAKKAGMNMAQSLSFVETLSLIELEPDRLGTLAQSTLRAFTNDRYRKNVTRTTGIEFFNKDNSLRNTHDVLVDLKRKYNLLDNDRERAKFMGVVFGKMDLDTQKGVNAFMTGDRLERFASGTQDIDNAKSLIEQDLTDNLNSATAVGSRLKATLGEAIDRMAQPLNKGFADFGSHLLDERNLSGEQLLFGGALAGIGTYYGGRAAQAGAGALFNKYLGGPETLKNIAMGKVLSDATGVTSVFVTNWPANLGGKGSDKKDGMDSDWWKVGGLVIAATQIGGSSDSTDEGRLKNIQNSKLHNEQQREYYTAFYEQRIALAEQNPDQTDAWISAQAQRLAQEQTGLTASGYPVQGAKNWAASASDRLANAALAPFSTEAAAKVAEERLRTLLAQPLVIEIRSDSHTVMADMEHRADIQVRRGQ